MPFHPAPRRGVEPERADLTVPHTTDQDPAEINLNVLTETNKLPKVGGARAVPKGAKSGLFSGESTEPSPRRG